MKGFLITILIAALPLIDATACISEGNTHNRYMFSVFRHEAMTDGPAYLYDIDRFWQDYMGENTDPEEGWMLRSSTILR